MNTITGKIVAKTPPIPNPDLSRDSIMYVWINSGSSIEKFILNSDSEGGLESIFLTLAASEVGDTLEYACVMVETGISRARKVLIFVKNIDKPFLF